MNIIIDAMGGDNAPAEIVKGAAEASLRTNAKLTLVGQKSVIEQHLKGTVANTRNIEIVHADGVITMEDDPTAVVRAKKDSSMSVGLRLLKDGGDAFLSAGNTGALHVGSSLIVRPVKGVQRSAIATILPFRRPMLMLDSGANVNVTSDYLVQWAIMGSIYMKNLFGIKTPDVGLLNNGAEEHKGTQTQIDAYALLRDLDAVHFIGNVEGKQLPYSPCDVLVTDGFTGNVTLKTVEGMSGFFFGMLKELYTKNAATKLSFLAMKDHLRGLKREFDADEYGGAPLLGLQKPVIKAHGSSDARAFRNAVKQAENFVRTGVIDEISTAMTEYTERKRAKEAEQSADAENN